ncbi:MAG: PQQ-dependent sugar dehydrogenase, partial [Chloroflexota bacterium]
HVAEPPDGSDRFFIVNKTGLIRIVVDGEVLPEPFLDISGDVISEHAESGLLSIEFHPGYADNGLFFVAFTSTEGANVVMRYEASANDPNRADPESGQLVIAVPDENPEYHNGGGLAFGPDGYLYIGTGDDTDEGNPQDLQALQGKMLRIDPLTGPVEAGERPYGIPEDNPFIDDPDARPEIWAYGLRNPWRFSFDSQTGDLYIADVGQSTWEEINVQPHDSPGGENYGWPIMEASDCFRPAEGCDQSGLTLPVAEYSHAEGCAVIGGHVYRGKASPALDGMYLFADLCSGNLWGLRQDAGEWDMTLLAETGVSITSFGVDHAGEIYATTFEDGALRKVVASERLPDEAPAFQSTWARSDGPVASGDVARTWIWGPYEERDVRIEPHEEAPDGVRTVVYFDKSRMEITDPDGDATSPWYVTNGLLVTEMISGELQVGDGAFETREPAAVNVAGDPDDFEGPTYATFTDLLDQPPLPFDQPVIQQVSRDGTVTSDDALAGYGITVESIDDVTGHAIAGPFWEFMNSEGPIQVDGEIQSGPIFPDPVFATGRPVTEPYWADVAVGGTEKEVLVQCFERRCLTYTPDNPEGWRVEAGNVGRHYETWRYGN